MDFKRKDNNLIWENYATAGYNDDEESSALDDLNSIGGEDYNEHEHAEHEHAEHENEPEVVMSFDTDAALEPEIEHETVSHEENELCEMICSELKKLSEYAKRLEKMAKEADFEEWMLAKITKAADYASDVYYSASSKADYANSPDLDDEYEF